MHEGGEHGRGAGPAAPGGTERLPAEARALLAEEEALLARVQASVERARARRAGATERERERLDSLTTLRDEASTALPSDLPALFQALDNVRALHERDEGGPLPERDAPYFAHLRLSTARGPRDYLLGATHFTDAQADVRVIDWRTAPVARVFYAYGEGDLYEEQFGDVLNEGRVEVRRLLIIERGVLVRVSAGGRVWEKGADGAWHAAGAASVLGGGAGTAARAGALGTGAGARKHGDRFGVTALLDAEQYAAVTAGGERPLLVLGSAGSGKTTVALHRLARIAAGEAAGVARRRMKVLVPEEGLARLSRRLLEPLGLADVSVQTLDTWAQDTARQAFDVPRLRLSEDPPALVTSLKRHPALRAALAERLEGLRPSGSLATLRRRLAEAYTDRGFLEGVVAASDGALPRTAVGEVLRHTMLQQATPLDQELEGYDPESLVTVDGKKIEEGTPDQLAGTLDVEDLPVLLALRAEAGELGVETLAHAVLDEAEDFSLFELAVVRRLLGKRPRLTLAGDEMQQTSVSFAGWDAALAELGAAGAATVRLQTSYRCPRPVAEFARRVLGAQAPQGPVRAGREGAPVGLHHFRQETQAQLFLREALQGLLEREPRASVAVIASGVGAARAFHAVVEDLPRARLVLRGDFTFEPGLDVTDVDSVKGLEWDYVVVLDATASAYPRTDEARRRLHVAVTRASHQLWVVSHGLRSRLVTEAMG